MPKVKHVALVALIALLAAVTPALVPAQETPAGMLWVTYVNATPTSVNLGDNLEIVFRVVYFVCDPYLGSISNPAVGVKYATFLVISIATQQSKEHPDTPVLPTGMAEGEYRAEIQIARDDPVGRVWVYVKGNSLTVTIEAGQRIGPPGNTSSEQTADASDVSLMEIRQAQTTAVVAPSPLTELLQPSNLALILALIVLGMLVYIIARRPRPASK